MSDDHTIEEQPTETMMFGASDRIELVATIVLAIATILTAWSASSISPMNPGTVETPASAAIFFEVILSPIFSIAPGGGPMKAMPSAASASAKALFSDRKPYPGCTASAPESRIACITFSITM